MTFPPDIIPSTPGERLRLAAAWRAGMEQAAQICERYAAEWIKAPGLHAEFRAHGADDCKEEIRDALLGN